MTIIASLLRAAELPDSPTARLDAELLLAAALGKSRSFLHTWPERIVPSESALLFTEYLQRRRGGEPVAYILGQQGFWKLDLEVAPHTLIPRPDTELLVEAALELLPATPAKVLDLGTGSGAIALALASERGGWKVTAVDRVLEAVALAERNRQRLHLNNATVLSSHWFSALGRSALRSDHQQSAVHCRCRSTSGRRRRALRTGQCAGRRYRRARRSAADHRPGAGASGGRWLADARTRL
jgi:release factor glutamine methyltransferase